MGAYTKLLSSIYLSIIKMAKKKEEAPKPVLERVHNIPLRREFLKVPRYRRANKAAKAVREFISKHMKSDDVIIGKYLNMRIWKHGIKNPPHHVKVNAVKDSKGKVVVELVGAPKEKPKVEEKKKTVKKEETPKPEDKKTEEKKEDTQKSKISGSHSAGKQEESKKIEKEEIKQLKKEQPKVQAPKMPVLPKDTQARPTAPKSQ